MTATLPKSPTFEAALLQAGLYHRTGDAAKAAKIYREILSLQPDHAAAITALARLLQDQGNGEEALAMFRRVVALKPDLALAHMNLGVILCETGRFEESFASFERHAEMIYAMPESEPVEAYKELHDQEQRDYLISIGKEIAFHIGNGSRVPGHAINPDVSSADAAARWRDTRPQIAVIDNFLADKALAKLRRFCLESTIWRKVYADGYLGAMPEHGIGSPLLAQIAEELRDAYPAIFSRHPLRHFWGFKYDSRLKGVAVHADFAAVNVNFWITPDEANLDPKSGGLVIWDKPAPLDWDFSKYNGDVASARHFLAEAGAEALTIPYRYNRAVIFDADLFHETDRINFKDGYLNRRINLTLLYGRRETAAP